MAYSARRAGRDAAAGHGDWRCCECGGEGADMCCNSCEGVWHHKCYRVHPERYEWLSTDDGMLGATAHFASLSRSVGKFQCARCSLRLLHPNLSLLSGDRAEYMCELIVGAQCAEMHAVTVGTQSGYVSAVKKADNFFDLFGVPVLPMHGEVTSIGLEMFMQHHSRVGGTRSSGRGLAASTLEGVRAGVAYAFRQHDRQPPFSARVARVAAAHRHVYSAGVVHDNIGGQGIAGLTRNGVPAGACCGCGRCYAGGGRVPAAGIVHVLWWVARQ